MATTGYKDELGCLYEWPQPDTPARELREVRSLNDGGSQGATMQYPAGVHAQVELEFQNGATQPLELALGPSDSFGNLEEVIERFVEAYCITVNANAFSVEQVRMCLFDPEELVVAFDADDDGTPDPIGGMGRRFAFAFISQMEEERSFLDPWLVVRPCTRDQVEAWHELMGLTGPQEVHVWCLDPQLQDWFG